MTKLNLSAKIPSGWAEVTKTILISGFDSE